MAAMRRPRLQVGSTAWIIEERSAALQIVQSEVEEFSYSARNELEWLNEHMADIFDENEINIAEAFKTPGKLRGKTPRTIRKGNPTEARVPLSDVFAATPNNTKNFASTLLNRLKSPLHPHASRVSPLGVKSTSPKRHVASPKPAAPAHAPQDSGYYGSQDINAVDEQQETQPEDFPNPYGHISLPATAATPSRQSPSRIAVLESPEKTFRTTKEDQTTRALTPMEQSETSPRDHDMNQHSPRGSDVSPTHSAVSLAKSPMPTVESHVNSDEMRSPSDGSSPIRPLVRKSSLNFASLPAREPLAAGKSIGTRLSRPSHLDNGNSRASYYNRPTGGKSLGNLAKRDSVYDGNTDDAMDVDEEDSPAQEPAESDRPVLNHTKTYTQRLQDQISMLGKSQGSIGQTKSTTNLMSAQQTLAVTQPPTTPKSASPRKDPVKTTPGAFPEDDDDDWIEPPNAMEEVMESRPTLSKSYTADVMEGIHSKETIGQPEFPAPKHRKNGDPSSPLARPLAYGHGFPSVLGHGKSASVSTMPTRSSFLDNETIPLGKPVTISNPSLVAMSEANVHATPSKSPSRSFRDSPLKQVKNKLSSILKSSRNLLASSAAISAEGKSLLSPSSARLGVHIAQSSESIVPKSPLASQNPEFQDTDAVPHSPKPIARRTRASVEREREEKRREREAKLMEEQMDKLDKAREKEREKARVFSKEQERIAAMEKEIASKKQDERFAVKETPNPTRISPRKTKASDEAEPKQVDRDVEMTDAMSLMPPPSTSKSAGPSQASRNKDNKRPVKPSKETAAKAKQAPPTVIRVNTGSQHSQYHPAGARVSTASHDISGISSSQLSSKASKAPLQTKPPTQNVKGLASSGRPKALEMAAKKKEQDEREAQRRREAKADMERKRAVAQEEQRKQEQQRRPEADRQRQIEEEKKNAQRQAAIEKAKQTRAPPPAVRSQLNGLPDANLAAQKHASVASTQKADGRPPSRMTSGFRDDLGRPVNVILSNATKAGAKRTLGPETSDEGYGRPQPSRGGPSYQTKDAKRRRTSENFDDELDMGNPPNIKGPPVRPSGGFKKDLPAKSVFQNGYSNAPHGATRDLFKATVTAQHNSHLKTAHPLDMAQISKGPIPFAPNPNAAGSAYKTPARPGHFNGTKSTVKAGARSSPRFQNGESIELPEIQTDDEDEDDETQGLTVAPWADSPDLRRALMRQETMDPSQIFGPPAPLNMEEVFNKSKDKWHKFRQRTSSANWSGLDRLTEDDIRKDMAARDKMRRDGGWSYEMSKDML